MVDGFYAESAHSLSQNDNNDFRQSDVHVSFSENFDLVTGARSAVALPLPDPKL